MTRLLNTRQAAEILGVHEKTIPRLIERGILRPVRITRKLQFTQENIEAAIAEHTQGGCGCLVPQPAA